MIGWATRSGDEILSAQEIINVFDLFNIAKSAAVFDFKKLKWINSEYIRQYPMEKITALFTPYIQKAGYNKLNHVP